MRIKGFEWGSNLGVSLAVSSPSSEMVMWEAMRVEEDGVRDRARLQKGVWWHVRNSSFFHERTEWRWE